MQFKFLFPNKYKKLGWVILIASSILGLFLVFTGFEGIPIHAKTFALYYDEILGKSQFFSFIETNITNTIVGSLFIIGGLLVAFSKEKNEDEYIANIRQSSLLWAVLVNYILLFFAFIFIYGTAFLNVMLYNMFTVLVIFIFRFNFVLYRNFKSNVNEK